MAVKLSGLAALQLGSEGAEMMTELVPIIRTHLIDQSLNNEYRAECAVVLSVCCFLAVDEMEVLESERIGKARLLNCSHWCSRSALFDRSGQG